VTVVCPWQGYTRTFGMRLPSGERREWLKPIMFSAGIGQVRAFAYHEKKLFVGFLEGSMLALFFKAGGPHTPVHKVDLSCESSG